MHIKILKIILNKPIALKIIVSAIIIVVIFNNVDLLMIKNIFGNINYTFLLLSFLILPISVLIRTYRWHYIMNYRGAIVDWSTSINIYFLGAALNNILPATSGDILKAYFGYKWTGIKERMLSVSILDKLIALSSISFFGIFSSIYIGDIKYFALSLFPSLPFFLLLLLKNNSLSSNCGLLFKKVLSKMNLRSYSQETDYNNRLIINCFILSIIGWLFSFGILWFAFKMVSADITISYVYMVSPILLIVRLFPFTMNGLGTDEAAIIYLFTISDITSEQLLIASLIYRLILMVLPGIVGIPILIYKRWK